MKTHPSNLRPGDVIDVGVDAPRLVTVRYVDKWQWNFMPGTHWSVHREPDGRLEVTFKDDDLVEVVES